MADGLRVAHTADLGPEELAAARRLLDDAFAPDMTDEDWDHLLGGIHVLISEDGELVAHGSVVTRRLLHGGRALRAGYVEGVAVRADRRRRGLAGRVLDELERIVLAAYDLGALGSSDEGLPFYAARGWHVWRGPLSALTPDGVVPTPDEAGGIFVLPAAAELDLDGELTCDWRGGDVW